MGLRQQLGNLFIIGFPGPTLLSGSPIEHDLVERCLGGVILFERHLCRPDLPGNIASPEQLAELTTRLQERSRDQLLICVDQEGGLVQRLTSRTGFVSTASTAEMGRAANGVVFTQDQAEQTARTLSAAGITINFAPVVDLNINRDNPIIGRIDRSFSDDPDTVVKHALTWIEAHNRYGITSCLKHFPGHGSSTTDSHLGFVDISTSWQERELQPYRQLIDQGVVELVMAGHLFNHNIDPLFPATLSQATITGLLRRDLGFDGVVLTDDLQMKGITDHYHLSEALCRCFAAGIDMVIIGNNLAYDPAVLEHSTAALEKGLQQGLVTEERIYTALDRVKNLKNLVKGKKHERKSHNA